MTDVQLSFLDDDPVGDDPPGQVGRFHPDTSWAAAYASRHANKGHRARILLALDRRGEHGMTAGEIAAMLGISTNIAGSRLIELRGEGCASTYPRLAERTNETRSVPGGRPARVHVLNDAGRMVVAEIRRGA